MNHRSLSRREFLKLAAAGAGILALPRPVSSLQSLPDFPQAEQLGRAAKGSILLKSRPDLDSQTLGTLYEDAVVPWIREVIGERPAYVYNNQRWVETPDGFVYGPTLQPVRNLPNEPVTSLPQSSRGPGMWVEVTVPYVDVILENQPTSNSWVEIKVDEGLPLRFYYSQVFWVDHIRTNERGVFYRVNPNYYGGVDLLWGAAEAFRPVQAEELAPVSPDVADKRVVVDVNHQMLSCFEGNSEVFYCRVSTGAKFDIYGNVVDKWSTPVGQHRVTRKYISLQMSGGATGAGYDLPGIGWSAIFATGGVAVHSTFWHNNFGDPMSHGCVNVLPEDAKWLFRWTHPSVAFDPGMEDVTLSGKESTSVMVVEG
jgi:lipoprotein-anchoring transpeptidase ErfK/SrfK